MQASFASFWVAKQLKRWYWNLQLEPISGQSVAKTTHTPNLRPWKWAYPCWMGNMQNSTCPFSSKAFSSRIHKNVCNGSWIIMKCWCANNIGNYLFLLVCGYFADVNSCLYILKQRKMKVNDEIFVVKTTLYDELRHKMKNTTTKCNSSFFW